ncbi:unnamed protein product [Diatraea saccharalis]|uniref:Uncharacterized protein n=1 Tax=Diatraea saccharalis TaxID=40085 RepID=A0A9N9WH32_9NEOP|nr:unnamed protein product [Diatraea saccharalis]
MKTQENQSSVPVSQMISESHTMDIIFMWLHAWSKNNPVPDEVNLDDSSALIGATVKAFTKYDSTADYVQASYTRLEHGESCNDKCYIRIDTSHFIKILFNLSCFTHSDNRVNFFYIKCLIELKNCDDYVKAKDIISDLIIICLNQRDGMNSHGIPSRCENSKIKLKKLPSFREKDTEIKIEDGDQLNATIANPKESLFKDTINVTNRENTALSEQKSPKWFYDKIDAEKLIITLSDDNDVGNHENLYYFPGFIVVLSRLMGQFPLWSNVMKSLYGSKIDKPTSSNVESYFKNLKRLVFKIDSKSHRLRVDEFITEHHKYLTGELKIANSNITAQKKTPRSQKKKGEAKSKNIDKMILKFRDDSVFSEHPSLIENWKGLGMVKNVNKENQPKQKRIILLSNGGRFTVDNEIVVTTNTCALDSVCQALAVSYIEGSTINQIIQESNHMLCQLIKYELISVYEAPVRLVFKDIEYELLSVMEFVPPAVGEMGHYKAHCKRGNVWQCYDDWFSICSSVAPKRVPAPPVVAPKHVTAAARRHSRLWRCTEPTYVPRVGE